MLHCAIDGYELIPVGQGFEEVGIGDVIMETDEVLHQFTGIWGRCHGRVDGEICGEVSGGLTKTPFRFRRKVES